MSSSTLQPSAVPAPAKHQQHMLWRHFAIGVIGFLTLVDLFATQAILPSLVEAYGVAPSVMGTAVNACTIGMAISGLVVALISRHIDRRSGIWISLTLLAIPTILLATMPSLELFTLLRVIQGIFMAAAFTLTMAYLAEQCSASEAASALAAYITGVVASNLFGRLISALVNDGFGLEANFICFALMNVAGSVLVFFCLAKTTPMEVSGQAAGSPFASWRTHLSNPSLIAAFGIGFIILFAFIGTFTYVNFVLVAPPLSLGMTTLGLVYFVFLPSMLTTPLAGRTAERYGLRPSLWGALLIALVGLPLLMSPSIQMVLLGLVLVGVGTFFAQAVATGFVSRAATTDRGAASGLYLASYYLGGLIGSSLLGLLFDTWGWAACIAGIGVSLLVAAALTVRLQLPATSML